MKIENGFGGTVKTKTCGQSLWRKSMTTSLQWHGEILSAANRKSLLIPEGYAHGFQATHRIGEGLNEAMAWYLDNLINEESV